jgi:hypothetical protein
MITEEDCGTKKVFGKKDAGNGLEVPISKNIKGRVAQPILKTKDGKRAFQARSSSYKR